LREKGVVREFDSETAARAFLGMFFSFFNARELHMFKKSKGSDADEIIPEFVSIFARGTLK
jgi:hypothetical protein